MEAIVISSPIGMWQVGTTRPASDAATQLLQDSYPNCSSLNPLFRCSEPAIQAHSNLLAQILAAGRRFMEHAFRVSPIDAELKIRHVDELEKVEAIISDACFRGYAVEARGANCGAHQTAAELPRRSSDKSGHRPILRNRADELRSTRATEQIVGSHGRPLPGLGFCVLASLRRENGLGDQRKGAGKEADAQPLCPHLGGAECHSSGTSGVVHNPPPLLARSDRWSGALRVGTFRMVRCDASQCLLDRRMRQTKFFGICQQKLCRSSADFSFARHMQDWQRLMQYPC
jgi:hypothetical protein